MLALFSCESFSGVINCGDPLGQSEMVYCAQVELKDNDTKLNNTYSKLRKYFDKDQNLLLLKSQRSWIKMRDDYCELYVYENKGTTSAESERANCLSTLTKERENQLKQLMN